MGIKGVRSICSSFEGLDHAPDGRNLFIVDLFSVIRRNNDMNISSSIKFNTNILHSILSQYEGAKVILTIDAKNDFYVDPAMVDFYDDISLAKYEEVFIDKSPVSNYARMIYIKNDVDPQDEEYWAVKCMYDMDNSLSTNTISRSYIRCLNHMPKTDAVKKLVQMGCFKCWIKYESKKDELKTRQRRDIIHYTFLSSYISILLKNYLHMYGYCPDTYMSTVEADFLVHKLVDTYSSSYDNIIVISKDTDYYTLLHRYDNVYIKSPCQAITTYVSSKYLWSDFMQGIIYDHQEYIYRLSIFYGNDYIQASKKYIDLIPLFLTMDYVSIDEYIRMDDYEYYKRYIKVILLISNCYKFESLQNVIDIPNVDIKNTTSELCKMIRMFSSRHKYQQNCYINETLVQQSIMHLFQYKHIQL